ncbi:MAG: 30S ribosomal protein S9 [Patescibacteria group bacterium]|jgi:small subunit ribosomal protein S9
MAKTAENKYYYGTGRRKTAIARVRVMPGKGMLTINGKLIEEVEDIYFSPMKTCNLTGFDISAITNGGGIVSQKEAVRLGVSRALVALNPENKAILRKLGFMTRDSREKERKKPGLKRARRAPQFAKR